MILTASSFGWRSKMDVDLDKLIRTWESILVKEKISKGMADIIVMTITELKELKELKAC